MKIAIKNKLYPLQLWLTSVICVAQLILMIKKLVDNHNTNSSFDFRLILLFIILGFALSSPTFLITWLVYELLFYKVHSPLLVRALIAIFSIAGVFITLSVIKGSMVHHLQLVYSASIITSSFLFKIKKVTNE